MLRQDIKKDRAYHDGKNGVRRIVDEGDPCVPIDNQVVPLVGKEPRAARVLIEQGFLISPAGTTLARLSPEGRALADRLKPGTSGMPEPEGTAARPRFRP